MTRSQPMREALQKALTAMTVASCFEVVSAEYDFTYAIEAARTALSGDEAVAPLNREQIARTIAKHMWCGATYDDATEAEKDAFVNAADAVLALSRPTSLSPDPRVDRETIKPDSTASVGTGKQP